MKKRRQKGESPTVSFPVTRQSIQGYSQKGYNMTSLDDYATIQKWAASEHELCIMHHNGQWWIAHKSCIRSANTVLLQAIRTALANIERGLDYNGNKAMEVGE